MDEEGKEHKEKEEKKGGGGGKEEGGGKGRGRNFGGTFTTNLRVFQTSL